MRGEPMEANIYCRSCGSYLDGTPELCRHCGARPLGGSAFCNACRGKTDLLDETCKTCGAKLITYQAAQAGYRGKSKTVSMLLAVFLGIWTWIYTYEEDWWKFWIGLGLSVLVLLGFFSFGVPALFNTSGKFPDFVLVLGLVSLGIWIWAIVDVIIKRYLD